jgi:hypothetical protein
LGKKSSVFALTHPLSILYPFNQLLSKILGSKATENFYLLPLHSSLFTQNAPENFEVRGNSEKVRSENYIGSDFIPIRTKRTGSSSKKPRRKGSFS